MESGVTCQQSFFDGMNLLTSAKWSEYCPASDSGCLGAGGRGLTIGFCTWRAER